MNIRTLSRHVLAITSIVLLIGGGMFAGSVVSAKPAQAAGCAAGEVGRVTTNTFTVSSGNADSYRLWLQLKGTSSSIISVELDGNNCVNQQISGLTTNAWLWSPIGAAQPISAGNHTMTIKVYTSGVSMLGGMLLNDGCNPNTESTGCSSQTPTPTPIVTLTPNTPTPVVNTVTPTPVVTTPPTITLTPTPPVAGALSKGSWNDSLLTYSGLWNVGGNDGKYTKYQGDDHWSNVVGSTYSFRYNGSDVALYGAKASHHGRAEVTIDNRPAVTIDQSAPTRSDNVLLYELKGLSSGVHTVSVKVLSGTITVDRVDVDQAVVTPTPGADTQAPIGPASVTPALVFDWISGKYRLDLTWSAATDNTAVTSYEVQRNGVKIGSPTTTSFGDTNIQPQTSYAYQIFALDAAGNRSSGSSTRSVTINCFWIFCGI